MRVRLPLLPPVWDAAARCAGSITPLSIGPPDVSFAAAATGRFVASSGGDEDFAHAARLAHLLDAPALLEVAESRRAADEAVERLLGEVTVPGEATPVDAYEIPHGVREAVLLRSPGTSYPWGSSTERRHLQVDHVRPYRQPDRGGPPGQTDPRLLAPLTGPEHQNKTHRRWSSRTPAPGVVLWRSPHGWVSLVTNQGTFPLGTTAAAQRIWRAAAPAADLVRAA